MLDSRIECESFETDESILDTTAYAAFLSPSLDLTPELRKYEKQVESDKKMEVKYKQGETSKQN